MARFGVLQCPVCDNMRLCPGHQYDDPEELKSAAAEHLKSHRLTESKYGIFRIMMIRRLDQVEVDDSVEVPIQQWIDETESMAV